MTATAALVSPHRDWSALPHFFLRQAGFAFDTLAVLTDAQLPALVSETSEADRAVDERRVELLQALRGDPGIPAAKVRRLVAAYRPVPDHRRAELAAAARHVFESAGWNEELARAVALRKRFADVYGTYRRRCAADLRALFLGDPALLDALLLSNPDNYGDLADWLVRLDPHQLSGKDRRRLDLLVMYLQRFCAKNDTNAHFGPISVGDVEPEAASLTHQPGDALHRSTFVSRWAADAVASVAWTQGAVKCRPRTAPTAIVDAGAAYLVRYRFAGHWDAVLDGPIQLGPGEAKLLELCDGSRTISEIERVWRTSAGGRDGAGLATTLASLVQRGLVIAGPDLAVGTPHPLRELAGALGPGRAAGRWRGVVAGFAERIAEFGAAGDVDERSACFQRANGRFVQLTGNQPTRRHGEHYADRSILYEECVRSTEALIVGGDLLRAVELELGLYLDLLLLPARVRLHRQRLLLRDWFADAFPAGGASVAAYLRRHQADRAALAGRFDAVEEEVQRLQRDIESLLLGRAPRHVTEVELDAADLRRFLSGHQVPAPALCNPDVMVIAPSAAAVREGEFRIVVGDCHAVREAISHTSVSWLVDEARPDLVRAVRHAYGDLLAPDEMLVDIVRDHDEKTDVQLPVADFDLELAGRSARERSSVLSYRDLDVRLDDGRLRLYSRRAGSHLVLTAAPVGGTTARDDPLAIFGFPRHFSGTALRSSRRAYLPRVRMGRVVLNRETWQPDVTELVRYAPPGAPLKPADDPDGVLRLMLYRRDHALPRYTFVSVPGEAKPVFIDFESPALVRQLWRLLRNRSGQVRIAEMLPGPGELWLDNGAGPVCSELRMALFASPSERSR